MNKTEITINHCKENNIPYKSIKMEKIIRLINGKYVSQNLNSIENTIWDVCNHLGYFLPSGAAESPAGLVFRANSISISLLVVEDPELHLCNKNAFLNFDRIFDNYTREILAENCRDEREALKIANELLLTRMIEDLDHVTNMIKDLHNNKIK